MLICNPEKKRKNSTSKITYSLCGDVGSIGSIRTCCWYIKISANVAQWGKLWRGRAQKRGRKKQNRDEMSEMKWADNIIKWECGGKRQNILCSADKLNIRLWNVSEPLEPGFSWKETLEDMLEWCKKEQFGSVWFDLRLEKKTICRVWWRDCGGFN